MIRRIVPMLISYSPFLLLILHFRAGDARVLGIARQRVALLLRNLVVGFHLVFARVQHGVLRLARRLRICLGLVTVGLGLLHADVLVVALFAVARCRRGLVVRIGLGDGRVVLILDVLLRVGRRMRAESEGAERTDANNCRNGHFHVHSWIVRI